MTSASRSFTCTGISNDNKRVHFGGSVDWEDERRRSCRGAESRQRRKERKLVQMAQQKQLQQAVLDILLDRQYENQIVNICNKGRSARAIRTIIENIIGDGENGNEENEFDGENDQGADDRLRRLLGEFRSSNKARIELLSEAELGDINWLKVSPPFTEEFRSILPSSVVTSSSEPSSAESTPERAAKRQRRDEKQRNENTYKRIMRDVEFQAERTVVPPGEDEKADEPN